MRNRSEAIESFIWQAVCAAMLAGLAGLAWERLGLRGLCHGPAFAFWPVALVMFFLLSMWLAFAVSDEEDGR